MPPEIVKGLRPPVILSSFNGAGGRCPRKSKALLKKGAVTHMLQWGRGQMPPEMAKVPYPTPNMHQLQWGRGQMPPEIRTCGCTNAGTPRASMGPGADAPGNQMADPPKKSRAGRLQWGRGQMPPEIDIRDLQHHAADRRFNGARGQMPPEIECLITNTYAYGSMLQWGRGQMPPEIAQHPKHPVRTHQASMGPGADAPGNRRAKKRHQHAGLASMGPGADAPGNTTWTKTHWMHWLLQWGRGQMPPEISGHVWAGS